MTCNVFGETLSLGLSIWLPGHAILTWNMPCQSYKMSHIPNVSPPTILVSQLNRKQSMNLS